MSAPDLTVVSRLELIAMVERLEKERDALQGDVDRLAEQLGEILAERNEAHRRLAEIAAALDKHAADRDRNVTLAVAISRVIDGPESEEPDHG